MKISVVIPMYNAEKTILNVLDSVQNQTFLPHEIVIVNDGSTDRSLQIVQKYKEENKKIPIQLIDKKNGGVSTARNAGIKAASGDWIALLDSDDEWKNNKLERQKQILNENPEIDFLATGRNDEIIGSVLGRKIGFLTKVKAKDLLIKNLFSPPTVIFKKSIVDVVGYFDETQCYAEEGNYFIRIAQRFNAYFMNESLVNTGGGKAHFGESGLSGNLKEMEKGELKNLRDAKQLKIINGPEYVGFVIFSLLKYLRRIIIVKFLR